MLSTPRARIERRTASGARRALVAVLLLTGVLAGVGTQVQAQPAALATLHTQPVMTGLEFPAAFTINPSNNNEIWYAERFSGEIRRRNLSTNQDTLVYRVPNVLTSGERGLLGIALHPGYPSSGFVYAYATRQILGTARNQILEITVSGGLGVSHRSIVNDIGAGQAHNGGRILFGPGGHLFAVIGEHGTPANAQVVAGNTNLAGKVLRLMPNGDVPAGNPFPGSFVWTFGVRNSFGFTFDPANGGLWLADNGPTCNDEVNRAAKGRNLSWGAEQTCTTPPSAPRNTNQSGPLPQVLPRHFYADATGITAAAFCTNCGLGPSFQGRLLVGFVTGQIHALTLDATRSSVVADELVYDHPGPVLSIETRPGRPVYFSDPDSIRRLTL